MPLTTAMARGKRPSFLLLLIAAVQFVSGVRGDCPGVKEPCSCGEGRYGQSLICKGITSELDLENAVQQNTKEFKPEEFVLEDSELRFITHDTFKAQRFLRFLTRNTTLLSLTNTKRAFEGLEKTLIELVVEKCDYVSHWDWNHLSHLSHLTEIQMTRSDLVYVNDFRSFPNQLTVLKLYMNEITGLDSDAFTDLTNLRTILLNANEIAKIERSMFPPNADKLVHLDLSRNSLKSLPDDIFTNMPALKKVKLGRNLLKTISHAAFRPVWKKLRELNMEGNPLICDCGLRWIVEHQKFPNRFDASCHMYSQHGGKMNVKELKEVHVRCKN